MESLIKDNLKEFQEMKGTISSYQHGFIEGRSFSQTFWRLLRAGHMKVMASMFMEMANRKFTRIDKGDFLLIYKTYVRLSVE